MLHTGGANTPYPSFSAFHTRTDHHYTPIMPELSTELHDLTTTMPTSPHLDITCMDRDELQRSVICAYSRLPQSELQLLLALRSLPTYGSPHDLAFRLSVHDLSHRTDLTTPRIHTPPPSDTPPLPPLTSHLPTLPPELWADIFEWVNDWELSTALNVHTCLRPPHEWRCATPLDRAILSGSPDYLDSFITRHPSSRPTSNGVKAAIRFNYTRTLSLLHTRFPDILIQIFKAPATSCPLLASRFGQTAVLEWWQQTCLHPTHPLPAEYDAAPLDEASRKGHVHVLQWWKASGLEMRMGQVMDAASSSGKVNVLEWWKNSGFQLQYAHQPLRLASYKGCVDVLEWWKRSGLRLIYDKEVLVDATKYNRVEVLEWWRNSGLRVEYFLLDIEAALEDATLGGGRDARSWWKERGVTFDVSGRDVSVREWTDYKVL